MSRESTVHADKDFQGSQDDIMRPLHAAINLRLLQAGLPLPSGARDTPYMQLLQPMLARQQELGRHLRSMRCPADQRIQDFLDSYLADAAVHPQLPRDTLVLDEPGLARELSLPIDGDEFSSPLLSSYRLVNGVLHNPASDRRTTAGVFHIAEGGLPIPDDKIAVDRDVFARLLDLAFQVPADQLRLPYLINQSEQAECFVSMLLRPTVLPEVPGRTPGRAMETRFIVPGGLVSNLDFIESVFGNAGDPYLPQNDALLDPLWSGHTGCVILAPHLVQVTKQQLGMPRWEDATERQRRDGQCWRDPAERYNDGKAFKVCARDERGVIVTVIADNYFGYCKKEVKTQISYAANLLGCAEEEHSGGARVYPAYNLGAEFQDHTPADYTLDDVLARDPKRFVRQPEGYAIDVRDPNRILVPAGSRFNMHEQTITWSTENGEQTVRLLADKIYFAPDGYRIFAQQRQADPTQWHMTGLAPAATQCHKPATVSGGGKSEISKSLSDAFVFGNAYAADFDSDMDHVQELLDGDYADRFADWSRNGQDHRPILSNQRSLGSVIKLLTPSSDYNDRYNRFLRQIPSHVKELLFTVKRYYKPEWGDDWRSHFSVGHINGRRGNAMRLDGDKIVVNMLRVGFEPDGSWRLFSLRPDFEPANKVQTEDDITASTVVGPVLSAGGSGTLPRKYVINCERRLFQRPDDAVHRGYDKQAERDLSQSDAFISNFQPLTHADARERLTNVQTFSQFTAPMQDLIRFAAAMGDDESPRYWVCSAESRLVDGKRSKNPRYLQLRPDLANPEATAAADLSSHLWLKQPADAPLVLPVDVVAAGRRNNPPEDGVPALCAYNPLHYMELPELFMEFISSMTGKSPSTTGAGSEGALTKGPFNAMPATVDLNAALLSYILTGYDGWLSSAGYIGPYVQVNHDISLLVPELFSRMGPEERDAGNLIAQGFLERLTDIEVDGRTVQASRLGYRINERFVTTYFGRIFLHPDVVFTPEMLRPELQDEKVFADSVDVIVETHRRVAQAYLDDGTIDLACPPLRALLQIMATGASEEGWVLDTPEFRAMFDRDAVLASDWYAERLDAKQAEDAHQARQLVEALTRFVDAPENAQVVQRLELADRLQAAQTQLAWVSSPEYRASLAGTIGRQVRLR